MDEKWLIRALKWKLEGMSVLIDALPKSLCESVREVESTIVKGIHASAEEYLSKLDSEEKSRGLQSVTID
ncbi:hypothetical protein [Paenibacillus segetis]|uniref:Uncharacterized protein n=1 Tax=Paenibacillus segetis TaxID=1325360 RepID=A0ABQ1YPF8_9BACL|nr:hypothetical protein [Paenibacillus segetis]GGH31688.1 hypothetical protein GCM10008013_35580 [Paenibacillus segetis]